MSDKQIRTIDDIARIANVSKSTVSRALNDSPLVKAETKARIQAIAQKHNFRIHASARNLSLRKSNTIAFATHAYHKDSYRMAALFGLEIVGGITNGLYARGYELLMVHLNPKDPDWASRYLDSGQVAGFILLTSNRKKAYIQTLLDCDAPFITWGTPSPDQRYPSVVGDDVTGGHLAAEHLLGIGRQRIAFLGGAADELEVQQRFKGFQTALNAAGRSIEPHLCAYGDYTLESGEVAMRQLLAKAPDLDAVFVNSDVMAIGAINVLQQSGRQVPEDVAVVGYDDLMIASLNNLPLTTIRQNIALAGELLAENLIQYLDTGMVTNVTVPVELMVRKSA